MAERIDSLPGCEWKIWQDDDEFAFTTDAVYLAGFCHLVRNARVLELGAGTGAISLLLKARGAKNVEACEINEHVSELLKKSICENNLVGKVNVVNDDLRNLKEYYKSESFDLVVANPPYRNSGRQRKTGTAACHEVIGNLEDFIKMASYMVKFRGRFAIVQLPERFSEIMSLAHKYKLELKRLQFMHATKDKKAWAFVAEFIKGGSLGGLDVLKPLIMYNEDGSHTKESLELYGKSVTEKALLEAAKKEAIND